MLTYSERVQFTQNPTAKKLFELMDKKRTNLCIAADFTTKKEILELAELLGPEICLLKTHIDIVNDFDEDLITQLKSLAEKHHFLIFEDRKFADIGNTVQLQYRDGIYHIADWADITNAHTVAGPGIIKGLEEVGMPKGNGLLLLAEMTPKGNLAKEEYTKASIAMAEQNEQFVIGFISTQKLSEKPNFIHMTPGVQFNSEGDTLGQQYTTPEMVIGEKESDIIIVGRGITAAEDPLASAKMYREAGWDAYTKRIQK